MPLYDFTCPECGDFTAMRRIAERNDALLCPICNTAASRVIAAPRLALLNSRQRQAHETNERSAHSPHTSKSYGGTHPAGCSCCGHGRSGRRSGIPTSGSRPWMLSH